MASPLLLTGTGTIKIYKGEGFFSCAYGSSDIFPFPLVSILPNHEPNFPYPFDNSGGCTDHIDWQRIGPKDLTIPPHLMNSVQPALIASLGLEIYFVSKP
jgi:hypothetical protein